MVYAPKIRRYSSKHKVVKQITKIARNIINSNHYISEHVVKSFGRIANPILRKRKFPLIV